MIEIRKFCDCCRDKIETPYLVIAEGYRKEDKRIEHYCCDCARILRGAWEDALRDRMDFLGIEEDVNSPMFGY